MEVAATVNLNGLEKALQELGPKLARKALRKAVKQVGEMWESEMKARVPVDSGDLKDSIKYKITAKKGKQGEPSTMKVSVGPAFGTTSRNEGDGSQQPGVYGMFEEFGTKKSTPHPFMRPTFDATADKAVQIFVATLRADLDDVVKGS